MNISGKFPVLVQSTGYLSDTNNSKGYTVDGDHYCQSSIRISIDPTIEGTTIPPAGMRLCLRFTLALRGTAIRASIDHSQKTDPNDPTFLKHYGECEATRIDDPWSINLDDAFLKSKKRPKDMKESALPFFRFDKTKTDVWDTIPPPFGSHGNPRYQLVYYEFDQYYLLPHSDVPSHLIFRLPTEPGKGRSISSDYCLFAIPDPVPPGFQITTSQLDLEQALKYANIERLNEEQLINFLSLIRFPEAQPPFKIVELIPQVADFIIKDGIDQEAVLLVLATVLHQDIEHTPILSIAAHVKEIRKDKNNERRFHTDTRIVEVDLPS